jgi:hypothetical protein
MIEMGTNFIIIFPSERHFSGAARVATSPGEDGCVPGTPGCLRVTLARAYQFSAWGQAYQRAVRNQAGKVPSQLGSDEG